MVMKETDVKIGEDYGYGVYRARVLSKHDGLAYVKLIDVHGVTFDFAYVDYGDLNVLPK